MLLKTTLRQMLGSGWIEDPRGAVMLAIYDEYKELFHQAAGSSSNHQAWVGGYADHVAECLRISTCYYDALEIIRPVPFTEDSAAICLFLHDIEKPFKYGDPGLHFDVTRWQNRVKLLAGDDFSELMGLLPKPWKHWEQVKWEIIADLQARFRFSLSDDEVNAIRYSHGEGNDYKKGKRIAGPLAAHVHNCDNTFARIWPEEGHRLSWSGGK